MLLLCVSALLLLHLRSETLMLVGAETAIWGGVVLGSSPPGLLGGSCCLLPLLFYVVLRWDGMYLFIYLRGAIGSQEEPCKCGCVGVETRRQWVPGRAH